MNDLTLYQITNGFMQVLDKEETGELSEEEVKIINQELTLALQQKSNNIVAYYQNRKALYEGIDEQIKRLQEYKNTVKSQLENFKEYVKENMELLGIEKIETELGKISIAKNPISVEVLNEDIIPDEYKEIVTTVKVDKKKIADNFKATGEIIDGVKIHTENKSIRIK